jgi:hypothetical protein
MFAGDVYYCWSCDAHCRAVSEVSEGAHCPRCREYLSEDCRLDSSPALTSFIAYRDQAVAREAGRNSPGLWPTRAAAMH